MSLKIIYNKDRIKIRRCRVNLKNVKVRTKECNVSVSRVPNQNISKEDLLDKVSKDLLTIEKAYSYFGEDRMEQVRIDQNISNRTRAAYAMYNSLPIFLARFPLPPLQPHQHILVCFEEAPGELSTFEVIDIIDHEEGASTTSSGTSCSASTQYINILRNQDQDPSEAPFCGRLGLGPLVRPI